MEYRLRVACADRSISSVAPLDLSGLPIITNVPPYYHGPNAQHVANNSLKAEFEKRKACWACFASRLRSSRPWCGSWTSTPSSGPSCKGLRRCGDAWQARRPAWRSHPQRFGPRMAKCSWCAAACCTGGARAQCTGCASQRATGCERRCSASAARRTLWQGQDGVAGAAPGLLGGTGRYRGGVHMRCSSVKKRG
jgi:hypothetical protein